MILSFSEVFFQVEVQAKDTRSHIFSRIIQSYTLAGSFNFWWVKNNNNTLSCVTPKEKNNILSFSLWDSALV